MTVRTTALGMPSRILHRHLAAEGTTFRLLVDEVRSALAEEMPSHSVGVAEVTDVAEVTETARVRRGGDLQPRVQAQEVPPAVYRART